MNALCQAGSPARAAVAVSTSSPSLQSIDNGTAAEAAPCKLVNRRVVMNAFVASASLTAVAVAAPSIAIGSQPDPIFALIEAHRAACEKVEVTYYEMSDIFESLSGETAKFIDNKPAVLLFNRRAKGVVVEDSGERIVIDWTKYRDESEAPIFARKGSEIAAYADEIPEGERAAWIKDMRAKLAGIKEEWRRTRRESGYSAASEAWYEAMNVEYDAARALRNSPPATLAGVAALVGYLAPGDDDDRETYHSVFPDGDDAAELLTSLSASLEAIGKV